VSFGFMGFLVLLLLANEAARLKFLGLSLKFALLGLCFLCFAAAVVPIFAGTTGMPVVLASMLAAACRSPPPRRGSGYRRPTPFRGRGARYWCRWAPC